MRSASLWETVWEGNETLPPRRLSKPDQMVFIGAWKDPVRNRWLFQFALLAGVLVVPWAMVFGALRGIPLWWRCIDSLFGIGAIVPAWWCHRWACSLEKMRE